jgi:hypothetical protein
MTLSVISTVYIIEWFDESKYELERMQKEMTMA